MKRALFLPTARQTNWLLVIGFLALGQALYLRYMALENNTVSLACQGGLRTWLCDTFRLTIVLFNHSVFGWVALAAAALNLFRPSIVLVTLALAASAFGIVLHNADLAGLAVGPSYFESGTSRARSRMTLKPATAAQNQTACQLAKLSLIAM